MSDYRNYVEDFPNHCKSILELARPAVSEKGYEVTLLLMVASTALTVPYERLKPEDNNIQPIQDRDRFQCAAKQLKELLDQRFLSSPLWNTGAVSSWKGDNLASVTGMPNDWKELNDPIALPAEASVSCVLKAIRNALAHGNLYTRKDTRGQITQIVFVTGLARRKTGEIISPYRFVEVSPDDFSLFLNKWFEFLTKLELPREFVNEILDETE